MITGLQTIQDYFQVNNLKKVDKPLLYMVLEGLKPEWCKGKSRISQLPRYDSETKDYKFYVKHFSLEAISERLSWVVETLDGPWSYENGNLYLISDTDVVYYSLRWREISEKS